MNEADEAIDRLLRDQFDGPIPDDGFCDQVMAQLPARRSPSRWPVVAGVVGGAATCWFSLLSAPLVRAGWQDWLSGHPSSAALVLLAAVAGMAFLALAWSIAEVDGVDAVARPSPGHAPR